MFSGLTNQFTSLVGAVKGGQNDEDVPVPTQDATASSEEKEAISSTEQVIEGEEGAKSGWLGSAKGWLGSASIPSMPAMPAMPAMPSMPAMPAMPSIPSIPGLRKGGGETEGSVEGIPEYGETTGATTADDEAKYVGGTEGVDLNPASGSGTPIGDEGQIGQVTTKVTQQAKHFGSFLSSAINKAGAKIKETVKDNTILDSFNKEQEAFIKGQTAPDSGVAPWIGHNNEQKIKEEILGLSQDRRNFVRAPPAGVDFEFNYDMTYPTAIAIMAEDKALETMRFELVPKIITEENFWRNYFYRVSLIIQAAELGTLGADGVGQASSGEDALFNSITESAAVNVKSNSKHKKHNEEILKNINISDQMKSIPTKGNEKKSNSKMNVICEPEFVSDAFQASSDADLQNIKDSMRQLGIDSMVEQALNDDEQWEKDLEAELKDYEVVSGSSSNTRDLKKKTENSILHESENDDELPTISNLRTRSTNNDWEEYADLIEDTDDLK